MTGRNGIDEPNETHCPSSQVASSPALHQSPAELEEQPRLPDAGLAGHERDLPAPGPHLAESVAQGVQLALRGR